MTKEAGLMNPVRAALEEGQSIWFDGLVSKAAFERMIREEGIRGATTNPIIFEKLLTGTEADADIRAVQGSAEDVYKTLAVKAVCDVADIFLPVWNQTRGEDGYVSIEVSPLLANQAENTLREAHELKKLCARPNVMIKIPATAEGVSAIEDAVASGISVNVTLIFSIRRYQEVMEAYLTGLERFAAVGGDLSKVASVASFFVSRVDTAVDKLLEEKAAASQEEGRSHFEALLGKTAIANSKAAYEAFEEVFSSERFRTLKKAGALVQRPLWASTGTKNPKYRDVLYVESLIGPNTVDTVPPATYAAFRDHGIVEPRLAENIEEAKKVLVEIARTGIDLEAITQQLEITGVQLFTEAYGKIIKCIQTKKN